MTEHKNDQKDHMKEEKKASRRESPTFGKANSSEVRRSEEDRKKAKSPSNEKRQ